MKYTGNYTKDTAKAIKAAEKLICTTTEDGAIYLCSGYWMYKMNPLEYATVAQPVTHCDAGNWTIDSNGKHDGNNGTNLLKIFEEAAKAAEHKPALERCPLSLNRDNLTANLYHSPDGFAAAYNGLYISAISKGHQLRAPGTTSPAVIYDRNEPFALIMPIRLDAKDSRAVLAYYNETTDEHTELEATIAQLNQAHRINDQQAEELEHLRAEVAELEAEQTQQHKEQEALRAKVAELEAQQAQPQEAAATVQQPAQADGKTAAEVIASRFADMAGVTTTIKGAQTAAPVIWLAGNTEEHAEAIKAAGGKWSNKKSAFYVRVA